jgi:hypothetical protein
MTRPAAKGWKGQSIMVQARLTDASSKARAIGLMPAFAHHTLAMMMNAAKIAGMAKKRWRDGDVGGMTIEDVRRLRSEMDRAFDGLEACLQGDPNADVITDRASAEHNATQHGMIGLTALAVVEEAGELSEPLHALALGATGPLDVRSSIQDEAADLRTWLHLVDTSMGIDPVATTQDKWNRSVEAMGAEARNALKTTRLDQDQIRESMQALARSGGIANRRDKA